VPLLYEPSFTAVAVIVCLHDEDCYGRGEWHVSYFDDDGGCYVTVFAGPEAEWRAREYFAALTRQISTIRAMMVPPSTVNATGRG